jgi:hypothetical protein
MDGWMDGWMVWMVWMVWIMEREKTRDKRKKLNWKAYTTVFEEVRFVGNNHFEALDFDFVEKFGYEIVRNNID